MEYTPQPGDLADMFLSEHSEKRVYQRFPRLRLKTDFDVYIHSCVSDRAEPMWAIPIQGGYIIGKWEKAKEGSRIKGIFIVQTALHNWQFKRSRFQVINSVQVHFRRVNSQIHNKIKEGKEVDPVAREAFRSVSSQALLWQTATSRMERFV
jgi:hypothetical protein